VGSRGGPKFLRESFTRDSIQNASGIFCHFPRSQLSYNPRARKHKVDTFITPSHIVPPETPVRSQLTSRQSSYPAVQQPKPSYTSRTKSGQPIKAHIRALPRTSIEREKEGKKKGEKKRRKETVSTANQLVTYTSTFRKTQKRSTS